MTEPDYAEILGTVEGHDPTPEAMSRMRARLTTAAWGGVAPPGLAQQQQHEEQGARFEMVVDAKSKTAGRAARTRWRYLVAGAASILVAGIAIVVFLDGDSDELSTGSQPQGTTSTPASPTTTAGVETAPEPTETAPTLVESFDGFWTSATIDAVFEENTYVLLSQGVAVDEGTYSTIVGSIRLRSGAGTTNCEPTDSGSWRYTFTDSDTVSLAFASDDCDLNRGVGTAVTLTRTAPFELP